MVTAKKIGVLAGGTSAEREVSLKSGNAILKALQELGYDAVFIDASENLCEALRTNGIEMAFLALHGGHGENGAVQGLLEVTGIPYTGSGILASAVAMDKIASKKIFLYHGVPVTPFSVINKQDCSADSIVKTMPFGMPWVVKPSAEGSSIGVSIVKTVAELEGALKDAFAYGETVIIEKYVKGKEIQIGILGDRALGGVEVRPSKEFYSYEAKYTPGMTQYILPPEIDKADYEKLCSSALEAHRALGCKGFSRVDFILDGDGIGYILEINTLPGMTETSLLPKIAKLAGIEFPQLVEEMLRLAVSEWSVMPR
ncbi:MAG: D-alanine--D-alanine ligase [Nitrospirae bacterium]|nr:MAG: D-alanine--D-alanine ligase [Nitrospirota bacterium]